MAQIQVKANICHVKPLALQFHCARLAALLCGRGNAIAAPRRRLSQLFQLQALTTGLALVADRVLLRNTAILCAGLLLDGLLGCGGKAARAAALLGLSGQDYRAPDALKS